MITSSLCSFAIICSTGVHFVAIAEEDSTTMTAEDHYKRAKEIDRVGGSLDEAITEYTKAIHLDPHFVAAYNFRANNYALKREYDKAVADIHKAKEIFTSQGNTEGVDLMTQHEQSVKALIEEDKLHHPTGHEEPDKEHEDEPHEHHHGG